MLAKMLLNMGVKLAGRGNFPEAEKTFRQAIKLEPNYAQAYNNLGLMLYRQRRLSEAEVYLERAIALNRDPDAYNNLALVFMDTNRLDKAEACLHQAVKAKPKAPEIYNNLGLVLEDAQRLKEAENAYRQAIKLNPDYVEAHYNLGNFLKKTHRLGNAENAYLHALKLCPGFESARFALAALYLLRGQFAKGWKNYNELRMKEKSRRQGNIPLWQGEDLTGKSILLFHEQGFGDTLQFVRYAHMTADLAAKTVLWVQKPFESLMLTSYPQLIIHTGELSPDIPFDFACSPPILPMLF
jgi:Flp pilus assembly protein TadD